MRYTQTLTLWHGVDRVDCRTTIDDFSDADQLLRLRWPCPVPGAMPVSEVGDAVIGRGFALLGYGFWTPSIPHSIPGTLDNPAYGWFGLSSALRVRDRDGVRAVSVAEVVVPAEAQAGALVRDLMVALARAGVTATCSGACDAHRPRYGYLGVDSNLPDARIVVGGPSQNAFTKTVLAAADPVYAAEVDRQLAHSGARRGVGARRGLVGRRLGARRRPARRRGAAGAGDRFARRRRTRRRSRGDGRRSGRRGDHRSTSRRPPGCSVASPAPSRC